MKTMFVHARLDHDVTLPKQALKVLEGKRVGLVSNVQHLHKLGEVKKQLPDAIFVGQVLGCRAENAKAKQDKVDCFLYVGTGQFHPIKVAMVTKKPVFVFSPVTREFRKLDSSFVEQYTKARKKGLTKYYHAKNVGVLITTKIGQNMGRIEKRKMKLRPVEYFEKKNDGKNYYYFIFDTLNPAEFENFTFIDVWVNTACSRIMDDAIPNMTNIEDVIEDSA